MEKMIAYCGIECSDCDAYKVTQTGDPEALEQLAASWREQFDPSTTADSVRCDGCLATTNVFSSYCAVCPLRACAIQRQEKSCAYCAAFDNCDKLETYFSNAPHMRDVLTKMRSGLS